MSFEIVEKNKVLREVILTVPGDDVRKTEGRLVSHACKTVKMNGFRQGKVPASVIRQKAGESIMEDARRECLQVAAREAINGIDNLLHVSEVEIVTPKTEDGGFVAKLDAEITPVPAMADYKGIEVTVADAKVTDDDVAAEIEKKREANSVLEPVEDRKVVEDGDVVSVELSAPNDAAEKIVHAGARQISVGKGYLNADMEKCLVGATIGEPVQLTATIDDAEAIVTCEVKEIRKRVLPALDDAFALDTGDAETLDGLREVTRKKLEEKAEADRKEKIENALLSTLRERMPIDMPENYVRSRAAQAVRMQLEQMLRQQIDESLLSRIAGNIREEEMVEYRNGYHDEVILNAIADAEKIEVADADIVTEAKKWFPSMSDDKVERWVKNQGASSFIGAQIKRDRALDIIRDAAIIKSEA